MTIPFVLAFEPDFSETDAWNLTNWGVTAIFAIDILVNLRTSYLDKRTGDEIVDGKKMAVNYLKLFYFQIDWIATVPFEVIFASVTSKEG